MTLEPGETKAEETTAAAFPRARQNLEIQSLLLSLTPTMWPVHCLDLEINKPASHPFVLLLVLVASDIHLFNG